MGFGWAQGSGGCIRWFQVVHDQFGTETATARVKSVDPCGGPISTQLYAVIQSAILYPTADDIRYRPANPGATCLRIAGGI